MAFSLALSGGGCRGAAHVGVLQALEEEGMRPVAVAGTSAGSIVAGLYACGYTAAELLEITTQLDTRLLDPNLTGMLLAALRMARGRPAALAGLLKGNRLHRFLENLTDGIDIAKVSLPLAIAAVDLTAGESIAFCDTPLRRSLLGTRCECEVSLADAITASCAVPAVFAPRKIGKGLLVDGGVTNNLPVDLLLAKDIAHCAIVAIDVSSEYAPLECACMAEVVSHSLAMMGHKLRDCTVRGERLLCRPKLPVEAGLFSFEQIPACIEAGYRAAKELCPLISML